MFIELKKSPQLLSGHVHVLQVDEALSKNFRLKVDIQLDSPNIDLNALLGDSLQLKINSDGGRDRYLDAFIVRCFENGKNFDKYIYSFELSSWLWFLEKNLNCRVFQNVDVPEIVRQIFERYDFAKFRFDLQAKYDKREYCVQFRETDFDFVNRLLEDEGIWYYFEHTAKGHTLVISDKQRFPSLTNGYAELDYIPDGEEGRLIREGVQQLLRSRAIKPNNVVLRDYDYHKPSYLLHRNIEERQDTLKGIPLEWYDYAPGYDKDERGDFLARLRLQAWQAQGRVLFGESNAIGLSPGFAFGLSLHPDAQRNRGFKILSCKTTFLQDAPDNRGQGNTVKCEFVALADDVPFHPLRITPKPHVSGIHSATVVGPKGSEVHTDNMSRIRVHFHWDRYKTVEEDASCWIRVSQTWAGKGWGVIAMPRVGQEVLITYVDGDLDRPLVTGIVYNGDNPPPYKLPERIRYSGIVSRSLRHGTPEHASQITIDDLRGNERVLIHAERDYQNTVERNISTAVANNSTTAVGKTATTSSTNSVSIVGNNFQSFSRRAAFQGISFGANGMSMNLYGTRVSGGIFNTGAFLWENLYKGITLGKTGWVDNAIAMSTTTTGSEFREVAFSQTVRATGYTYTQHSQNFSSYSFNQNQSAVTVIGNLEKATVNFKKNAGLSQTKIGTDRVRKLTVHLSVGPLTKKTDGNSHASIGGDENTKNLGNLTGNGKLKNANIKGKKTVKVDMQISESVPGAKRILTASLINHRQDTELAPPVPSVPGISGGFPFSGNPKQTQVVPPVPQPQPPMAVEALSAVVSAAGPASVGLQGAQELLQTRFKASSGTSANKPAVTSTETTKTIDKETVKEKLDISIEKTTLNK
jgi:type VI secretion system secreted protein VgrG